MFSDVGRFTQVASVDEEAVEILETDCGSSVIVVNDVLFELSGVDLQSREMQVVDVTSIDCAESNIDGISSDSDCYRYRGRS